MSLKERLPLFLARAKAVASDAEIKALCREELDWLYANYTPNSVHTYITRYRTVLENAGITEPFLYISKWDDDRQDFVNRTGYFSEPFAHRTTNREEARKSLQARHGDACEQFPPTEVLIQQAVTLLSSHAYSAVLAGLLLLLGRRQYEIAVLADIVADVEQAGFVSYRGQAKTRDPERVKERRIIPVLADATLVCNAVAHVRQLCDFTAYLPSDADPVGVLASAKFGARTQSTLQKATEKYFTPLFDGRRITPKELRKIYAVVAYKYTGRSGQTFTDFLSVTLGHKDGDYTTARHYEDYMPYIRQSV